MSTRALVQGTGSLSGPRQGPHFKMGEFNSCARTAAVPAQPRSELLTNLNVWTVDLCSCGSKRLKALMLPGQRRRRWPPRPATGMSNDYWRIALMIITCL